jgi:hypothetical protein
MNLGILFIRGDVKNRGQSFNERHASLHSHGYVASMALMTMCIHEKILELMED